MKTACVIFARGGSTRVPKKAIKDFHGKPIIAYSIKTALETKIFDNVIVNSDCDEILRISREYGAETYKRPEPLGRNNVALATLLDSYLQSAKGRYIRNICVLLPTAPLLSANTLSTGYLHYDRQRPRRAVISVSEFDYPVYRALSIKKLGNKSELSFKWPEYEFTQSQEIEVLYHDAGQFYILNTEYFKKHKKIFLPGAEPLVLPKTKVCDIDTLEDWKKAEIKYKYLKEKGEL